MTQHYAGTKIVEAWPSEKDGADGYAVKYADGYISWSPAEVFEEAYLPLGHIGNLPAHAQRIAAEHAQLNDRINKLEAFLRSDRFLSIPVIERADLEEQRNHMNAYFDVLKRRYERAVLPA